MCFHKYKIAYRNKQYKSQSGISNHCTDIADTKGFYLLKCQPVTQRKQTDGSDDLCFETIHTTPL